VTDFDPLYEGHAIERCSATVALPQPLPPKLFSALRERHAPAFRSAGLEMLNTQAVGVHVDLVTGRVSSRAPIAGAGPFTFVTPDKSAALAVNPNAVTWQTSRYIRWAQFEAQLEKVVFPILQSFLEAASASLVRLDYIDRFLWRGDWDNFSVSRLLQQENGFVTAAAHRAKREWHTHTGWLELNSDTRRVVNINVDVTTFAKPDGTAVPSVSVLSLLQDETLDPQSESGPFATTDGVTALLRKQHEDLKGLLRETISSEMAGRIGLNL
jgi:uncharacterized protein (TIGR04255 family)